MLPADRRQELGCERASLGPDMLEGLPGEVTQQEAVTGRVAASVGSWVPGRTWE